MEGNLFKGIKQWEFEAENIKGKLPIFYYDNTSLTAVYTASTERVKNLLPHRAMKPVEFSPGKCLVAFTAFEYRETDIGPYNEVSIAFPIVFGKPQIPWLTALAQMVRRRVTAYVWQLPVTTEIARAGGVEFYGYPKFLARITFQREADRIECALAEGDETILSLEGKMPSTRRGKVSRYVTYSVLDGIPLVANVLIDPIEYAESRKKNAARVALGTNHPISKTLSGIGLSEHPILYQFCPRTQAILFGGRNLIDC